MENKHKYVKFVLETNISTCLISSDCFEEITDIIDDIRKYKSIVFYKNNSELNQLQNDFTELLLCSKANIIIGSYMNTYSELIWWYSKCNRNIYIV